MPGPGPTRLTPARLLLTDQLQLLLRDTALLRDRGVLPSTRAREHLDLLRRAVTELDATPDRLATRRRHHAVSRSRATALLADLARTHALCDRTRLATALAASQGELGVLDALSSLEADHTTALAGLHTLLDEVVLDPRLGLPAPPVGLEVVAASAAAPAVATAALLNRAAETLAAHRPAHLRPDLTTTPSSERSAADTLAGPLPEPARVARAPRASQARSGAGRSTTRLIRRRLGRTRLADHLVGRRSE